MTIVTSNILLLSPKTKTQQLSLIVTHSKIVPNRILSYRAFALLNVLHCRSTCNDFENTLTPLMIEIASELMSTIFPRPRSPIDLAHAADKRHQNLVLVRGHSSFQHLVRDSFLDKHSGALHLESQLRMAVKCELH